MSTSKRTRTVSPRMVAGMALAGGAAAFAALPQGAAADGATAALPDATLWLAQATGGEGGEGGEGGAPAEASDGTAYLIELGKLEAHIRAARRLYDAGAQDEAAALAGHPEAEFMDGLRGRLAARGVTDLTPEIDALVSALLDRAGVDAAFEDAMSAIRRAERAGGVGARDRYDAILHLARDAAAEYDHAVADGQVVDLVALEEARGFLDAAGALVDDAADGAPGARVHEVIAGAGLAFPGDAAGFVADPSILHGAAARIEIAALGVR